MSKANFSFEEFCQYLKNKMSMIYKNDQGEYLILQDTQPLQEFGILTEKEALKYIYDNSLFEKAEEIIKKNTYNSYQKVKEYEKENSISKEDVVKTNLNVSDFGINDTEMYIRMEEDEEAWELEI